jgi:hypothetical protein
VDRGPRRGPRPRHRHSSRPSRDERLRSSPAPVKHAWSPPLCKKAPVFPNNHNHNLPPIRILSVGSFFFLLGPWVL